MPQFGSPFSELANARKLTDEELVRAIRFMVAAEYEATQMYMQLAESTENQLPGVHKFLVRNVLEHCNGELVFG